MTEIRIIVHSTKMRAAKMTPKSLLENVWEEIGEIVCDMLS